MENNFISGIKRVFGTALEESYETDTSYMVELYSREFTISKEKIRNLYSKYSELTVHEELGIYSNNYYECLIEENGPIIIRDEIVINDNRNNVEYRLGRLSEEYIIFLFQKVFIDSVDYKRKLMLMGGPMFRKGIDEVEDFFDLLRLYLRRFTTLRIITTSSFSISEYKTRVDAILFNISFNTGFSINKVNYIDEYFGKRRQGNRRNALENIEAPQRKYISDLVYHYQMALSTHHPALQFISFYHIIEHFFQKVFYEKIVSEIRDELTSPRFSAKRDKDINKLIKYIKKKIKLDNEHDLIKNESEALKFTLMKYVSLEKLEEGLSEINSGLLDYYSNSNVSFSNGSKINFSQEDEKIYKQISNRIYKTRNAVIHSKSDEKERYMPFKHEGQLLKEIPLLQIIAEEIIISTSQIL